MKTTIQNETQTTVNNTTETQPQNTAQIDYLTVRFAVTNPVYVINCVLSLDENLFEAEKHGRYGYTNRYHASNINIYYNNPDIVDQKRCEQMGVCLEMSGQGCREYEKVTGDPLALAKVMFSPKVGAVTRIDLAYDDIEGKLDLERMIEKANKKEIRTKMRRHREIRGFGEEHGHTLYLGSAMSNSRLRIYDKAAEQGIEGKHWIRVEIALRHDDATIFTMACRRQLGIENGKEIPESATQAILDYGASVILKRVVFFEEDKKTRSLCPVSPWWEDFFKSAKPIDLKKEKNVPIVKSADDWIRKGVAVTLVILLMLLGPRWLVDIIKEGLNRISTTQRKKYNQFFNVYKMDGHVPNCEYGKGVYLRLMENLEEEVMNEIIIEKSAPASEPAKTEMQETET